MASDFHRPSVLMSSREIPAAIAEFAAPRRKEWPEYVVGSNPDLMSDVVSFSANQCLLNGPHSLENNGSALDFGYRWKRVRSAETGQVESPEGDIGIVSPFLN